MRVLLLGGTGFLGSHLLPLLLERGHSATVMTRSATKVHNLESQGVTAIVGDLLEPASFMSSLLPQDIVVNIAMPIEFGRMSKAKVQRASENTSSFISNALTMGEKLDCPTILTLGTSYRTKPGEVADESWSIDRFGMTLAGAGADKLISDAIDSGQPLIQMIPGQIYGPGGNFMRMYEMMMSGRFGVFGKGDNYLPRIHVEDCASAFLQAIETKPIGEKFIVADDTPCTIREFTEHMASCAGRSKPRTFPRFIARLILGKLLLETMEMNCIVSNAKAKSELGWDLKYPSYREGLDAVIRSIQAQSNE